MPSKKTFLAFVILSIIFSLIGYIIAPPDHPKGTYIICAELAGENIRIYAKTTLEDQGPLTQNITTWTIGSVNMTLVIIYQSSYERQAGKTIWAILMFFINSKKQKLSPDMIVAYLITPTNNRELMHVKSLGENVLIEKPIRVNTKISFAFFFFIIPLWSFAAIHRKNSLLLAIIFLIPIFSCTMLEIDPYQIIPAFFDPVIALLLGLFIVGLTIYNSGLSERLVLYFTSKAKNFSSLTLILLLLSIFISMWFTPFLAILLLLPAVTTILKIIGKGVKEEHAQILVFTAIFGAMCGSMMTFIGSPANILTIAITRNITGKHISLISWFLYALVPAILSILVAMICIYLRFARHTPRFDSTRLYLLDASYRALGPIGRREKISLGTLIILIILWIIYPIIGIPISIIPLIGAFILLILGVVKVDDLRLISWDILLILGGSIALSRMMYLTGIIDFLISKTGKIPLQFMPFIILTCFLMSFALDQLAAIAIMLPILLLGIGTYDHLIVFLSLSVSANLLSPSNVVVQQTLERRGIIIYKSVKDEIFALLSFTIPAVIIISILSLLM